MLKHGHRGHWVPSSQSLQLGFTTVLSNETVSELHQGSCHICRSMTVTLLLKHGVNFKNHESHFTNEDRGCEFELPVVSGPWNQLVSLIINWFIKENYLKNLFCSRNYFGYWKYNKPGAGGGGGQWWRKKHINHCFSRVCLHTHMHTRAHTYVYKMVTTHERKIIQVSFLVWAATTKYHRLGNLRIIETYLSQF